MPLAQPACLAGPFGQVDPALFPVWLGSVSETQSIFSLGSQLPTLGGMALRLFRGRSSTAACKLMRTDRGDAVRFDVLALLIAIPLSFWQIKLCPTRRSCRCRCSPSGWRGRRSRPRRPQAAGERCHRLATTLVLVVIAGVAARCALSAPSATRMKEALKPVQDCQSTAACQPLAQLPAGLAVADVNLGPTSSR